MKRSSIFPIIYWLFSAEASLAYAESAYSNCKEFAVGDLVEQYRHWDHEERKWNNWQEPKFFAAKWKVVELPRLHKSPTTRESDLVITVQLVQGEYRYSNDDAPLRPGQVERFFSSISYQKANPKSYLQFCDEFRKVR